MFSQTASNKEVYLFMLGLSEEELIKELEEFDWRELKWRDEWETLDSCGCCFTAHSAGFYGKSPICEGGRFKMVSKNLLFDILSKIKEEKKTYQY